MPILRFIRADGEFGTPEEAGQGIPLPIVAATAGRKSDGIDLAELPWDFSRGTPTEGDRFRFGMLWVHDFQGRNLPIGVMDVGVGDDDTSLTDSQVIFDPDDTFAVSIERKYRSEHGGLSGFSISWDPIDADGISTRVSGNKPVANQFLEGSAVPVPLDGDALAKTERQALARLYDDLEAVLGEPDVKDDDEATSALSPEWDAAVDAICERLATGGLPVRATLESTDEEPSQPNTDDDNGDATPDPDEVAAAMVALFDRASDLTDEERRRTYQTLLPKYRLLGWEPPESPEHLPISVVRSMDDETWKALFLAGEWQRVGKELSARNVRELTAIRDMLSEAAERVGAMVDRVTASESDGDGDRALVAMLEDLTTEMENDERS